MWCWWTYTKNHVSRCVFIETTLNVIHKKLQNSRGMIWHIQNVHLRKAKDKKVAYKQILSSAHTHTQVALNLQSPTIHTERYTIHNVQMKWLSKELKTCLAKKFILEINWTQFNHLFLSFQGTKETFFKALITNSESASSHNFDRWCEFAISIGLMAPDNSTCKEFPKPVFSPKQSRKSKCYIT